MTTRQDTTDKKMSGKKWGNRSSIFYRSSFCRLLLITLLLAPLAALNAADVQKPNIILFLIDDPGWRDLGCQGSTFYQTSNIDQLAKEGVRFTEDEARGLELTGKPKAKLDLSHFWVIEDRETKEFVISYPRAYGGNVKSDWVMLRVSLK